VIHRRVNHQIIRRPGGALESRPRGIEQTYDNDADEPAVALLDSGLVLEVHSSFEGLYSRTGKLDPTNSALIQWSPSVKNGGSEVIEYPALATNGRYAFQTHEKLDVLVDKIYYSGAEIYCEDL
jgi:hypothetical protein